MAKYRVAPEYWERDIRKNVENQPFDSLTPPPTQPFMNFMWKNSGRKNNFENDRLYYNQDKNLAIYTLNPIR